MLFSSIGIYVSCSKLAAKRTETPATTEEGEAPVEKPKKRKFGFVVIIGKTRNLKQFGRNIFY